MAYLLSAAALAFVLVAVSAQDSTPGQPKDGGPSGMFKVIGDSLVSGQQIFLGTNDKVYIIDKAENNPTRIGAHPAWGSEYTLGGNKARPMDLITNTFCAGGNVLGNGTWVNVGGNAEVMYGGENTVYQDGGGPYHDPDGSHSVRLLDPCDDGNCAWTLAANLTTRRWYPTVETLEDGSLLIVGGSHSSVFVNDASSTNPTYEFWPPRGAPVESQMLLSSLPANLYPLTFLLPSGKILLQANWKTAIVDYQTGIEKRLDDMPDAVRTYPASAGVVMLPLTPANNWTATVLFCGGANISSDQWKTDWNIAQNPASQSCVQLAPDVSPSYSAVDPLPEGRTMGNIIQLPNGKVLILNGAATGVAGNGNDSWAIGESYADHPLLHPVLYNPNAPAGSRWTKEGMSPSEIPRMYHSSAILLPDGSVFVAGSNPNYDYNVADNIPYKTEYRVEKFFPSYFNQWRPEPQGLPANLGYGGNSFDVGLPALGDMVGDVHNIKTAKAVVMRTGFSTHGQNMGQRMVELQVAYTMNENGSAILHCSQLPPNPAVFPPGPALLFIVVGDVPSVGKQIMVGSGKIGAQPVSDPAPLPNSFFPNTFVKADQGNSGAAARAAGWAMGAIGAVLGIVFV
ncbi:copper radical oxidase [Auriscalpium vulgare]|uniref:Copper radical oxidase n=1 Tax=Auriscalpium vulgare TaxID=40419 RepID=A0ACB8RI17_9AGAM|nr:copper radical oxidase [Auriscalpium vulgare]